MRRDCPADIWNESATAKTDNGSNDDSNYDYNYEDNDNDDDGGEYVVDDAELFDVEDEFADEFAD